MRSASWGWGKNKWSQATARELLPLRAKNEFGLHHQNALLPPSHLKTLLTIPALGPIAQTKSSLGLV